MLTIFTAVLVCSCAGMIVLFWLKHWELSTGRMLVPGLRPRLALAAQKMLALVEERLPRRALEGMVGMGLWLRRSARDALARGLISLEHMLEQVLFMLRHGFMQPRAGGGGKPSNFLQEVTEHKRKLTRMTRVRRKVDTPQDVSDTLRDR